MSRPRKAFVDSLDEWLQHATEQEVRDAISSIRIWARWRKFSWSVKIQEAKPDPPKAEGA